MVYVDAEGVMKSSKPVDEKLVERRREGVHPGKVGARRRCRTAPAARRRDDSFRFGCFGVILNYWVQAGGVADGAVSSMG